MNRVVDMARLLSSPQRLMALMVLTVGEMCLCDLEEVLGLAPSSVSRHMSILEDAGLVLSERRGRWTYFRLRPSGPNWELCAPLVSEAVSSFEGRRFLDRVYSRLSNNTSSRCV